MPPPAQPPPQNPTRMGSQEAGALGTGNPAHLQGRRVYPGVSLL